MLDAMDILYYRWGQKLLVVQQETVEDGTAAGETRRVEMETDFEQRYLETRVFENEVHTLTNRSEYQKQNERIIPFRDIHIYYSELPSGTPYQITETETYLSYQVLNETGGELVNWQSADTVMETTLPTDSTEQYQPTTPTEMVFLVSPNPATDNISIKFPININAGMEVKITDMMGVVYFQSNITILGNEFSIDIQHFPTGMYYISCTNADGTAHTHFLKQ
jgi:hypothetical protein